MKGNVSEKRYIFALNFVEPYIYNIYMEDRELLLKKNGVRSPSLYGAGYRGFGTENGHIAVRKEKTAG